MVMPMLCKVFIRVHSFSGQRTDLRRFNSIANILFSTLAAFELKARDVIVFEIIS